MIARALALLAPGVVFGLAAIIGTGACSGPANPQIGIDGPPYGNTGPTNFHPVGNYLEERCGTLDCHGQTGRNFRVWGQAGMRLDADASPGGARTTEAEYEATYRSLVGLEPQLITAVYAGCQSTTPVYPPSSECHPEYLKFIDKARGLMAHKGGQLICVEEPCPAGLNTQVSCNTAQIPACADAGISVDPQDVCLVTFLEGVPDPTACSAAEGVPTFPEAGAP